MRAHGGERALGDVAARADGGDGAQRKEDERRGEREDRTGPARGGAQEERAKQRRAQNRRARRLQHGERTEQLANLRGLAARAEDAQRKRVHRG